MTETSLQALGDVITWLGAKASAAMVEDFRRDALVHLRRHVPFDRAIWAEARIEGKMALREPELFGIATNDRAAYEAAAYLDPRLPVVLATGGRALAYSAGPDDPASYVEAISALGLKHFLSIARFEATLGIASGLVLFSGPKRRPFTARQRDFIDAVFSHLVAAWTECQVAALDLDAREIRPSLCKATVQGLTITAAQPELVALLRLEWPDWVGPDLPPALIDEAVLRIKSAYDGAQIIIRATTAVDTAILAVRRRAAVDDLTGRERAVAELCAAGLSHKEIAVQLGIAPATARNHIAAVHRRLKVRRNSEVGPLLAR